MKRVMNTRAAALALAAPLLFAAPALADHGKSNKRVTGSISVQTGNGALQLNVGQRGYSSIGYTTNRRYSHNDYRYNNRQVNRQAKRQAIRACRQAIRNEAHYLGFRDVDFDDGRYAERIGPRGYRVTFNEVEFETRRRDIERPVTCIVRGGDQVRDIRGLPSPRGHGQNRNNRNHRNNRYYK